jgi:hypothetical protein
MPRCKHCKEKFTARKFLQKYCMEKDECIKVFLSVIKATKWKADKAVLKDKLKTLGQYEAEAKIAFQRWIRLRDLGKPCISCGKVTDEMDAGHFKKAEIYSGVIFNENNCHSQCRKCNRFQNGNELNYRLGLIDRYGLDFAYDIEQLANDTRQFKFTKDQLIAKKMQYNLKYKEDLKK